MPSTHSDASRILGERFRQERQRLSLTQMDLAYLAGMNVANYGKIERGVGNPNFETIVRLAGVMGVDPAVFVQGITLEQLPPTKASYTAKDYIREREQRARP